LTGTIFGKAIRQKQREKKLKETLKQLKKAKEEYWNITNLTGDTITKIDQNGRWTFVNNTACKFFGKPREELLKCQYDEFLHPEDAEKTCKATQNLIKNKKMVKGFINRQKTPKGWRIVEWNAIPSFDEDENYCGFQCTGRDITERKKAEKAIKQALARSKFYKDLLSHDMANILTNIKSSVRLMEMWEEDSIPSERRGSMLNIIAQEVERGISLISNVRKLTEIKEKEKEIQILEVKKILKKAIKHTKSRVMEQKIKIHSNYPKKDVYILGGDLLLDAFENILLNACIHNNSEEIKLWIKLSFFQKYNEKFVKIEFKDNGIGISERRKEIIFDRNYDSRKGGGGMGIGLSLVEEIITKYGGKIWVENRVEGDYTQGSNFIVLLKEK